MDKITSFTIGKVTGVHGLNGNLKVWSFAQSIETFNPDREVLLKREKEQGRLFTILKALPQKKGIILTLEGLDNRTLAESFIGCEIIISRDQLPEPEENSWYWEDLINLDVVDHNMGFIGKVTEIFPTGAHDILVVIDKDNNKKETLVPMHKEFVKSIDAQQNEIKITLPPGFDQIV